MVQQTKILGNNMKNILRIIAAVISLLTVFSCTKEIDELIDQPTEPDIFTLSIKASKGEFTKALELSGNTLNAIWDGSETVYVFKNDTQIGELTPDLSTFVYPEKVSCTLTGPFTTVPEAGDVLTLKLTSNNYSGQDGTLAFIAGHCDYAVATLHVTGVINGQIESTEGKAAFENQQAIVKFTLKDKADGTTLLTPTTLTVNDGTSDIATVIPVNPAATYTTNGDGVLYVAIPPVSGDLTITASDGTFNYKYTKTGASFTAGQYYNITVKMIKYTVDLSALETTTFPTENSTGFEISYYTVSDGDILTGTFPSDCKLYIPDGATVTLNGVTHNAGQYIDGIECLGSAKIILAPGSVNDLTYGDGSAYFGIYCNTGYTLTIEGPGTLNASGAQEYSGIGGWGSIVIEGGIINATGGPNGGAGIGSGAYDSDGYNSITINGGEITAIGGSDGGAGIGTGLNAAGGAITITGGTINATGGYQAAGIGGGYYDLSVEIITITDGVTNLKATRGSSYAKCIGKGNRGQVVSYGIIIDGVTIDPSDSNISGYNFDHFNTINSTNDTWEFIHKPTS